MFHFCYRVTNEFDVQLVLFDHVFLACQCASRMRSLESSEVDAVNLGKLSTVAATGRLEHAIKVAPGESD